MFRLKPACALIGSTFIALLPAGSSLNSASSRKPVDPDAAVEMKRLYAEGASLFAAAQYARARIDFLRAAEFAQKAGDESRAAFDWKNAGSCSIRTMQFGQALQELKQARQMAETAHLPRPLLFTMCGLASLYTQMRQFGNAVAIAQEALNGPAGHADEDTRDRLLCQLATGLVELHRFGESVPYFFEGFNGLLDEGDLETAALALANFGSDALNAGDFEACEWALSYGLHLVRIHRVNASASILLGLARLRSRQGRLSDAAILFDAALSAPPGPTPRWGMYKERGRFRLESGDIGGALGDYREARRIVTAMRVAMVPADQDRVTLESGISDVMQGLVEAGNRVALSGGHGVLRETFDAAEQDRYWSLRALVPTPNDWRSRLPPRYWELLAEYQNLQRAALAQSPPVPQPRLDQLGSELQQIEVAAAGEAQPASGDNAQGPRALAESTQSPLDHAQSMLDENGVLFSFHLSKTSSWVWAVDRHHVDVYRLPRLETIQAEATAFTGAVRSGSPSITLGAELYKDLFGAIGPGYLRHSNWHLELDGPLFEVPFSALVTRQDSSGPVYLIEQAALQAVPGALLLRRDTIPAEGELLAIGDPIYNTADERYHGERKSPVLTLPRLPSTASEIEDCARAWNPRKSTLLTGTEARPEAIDSALRRNPAIIHFATHVIPASGDFGSGLIALSIDSSGAMALLGPKDIAARPTGARLVVINGCRSAQGQTLPGAGLMGLTRAWIGAGASAVLATYWELPDTSQSLVLAFYRCLRTHPERGAAFALREAQLEALKERHPVANWSAYSLFSRTP